MNDFFKQAADIARLERQEIAHVQLDGVLIANATPHDIIIVRAGGNITIPRTGFIARAQETFEPAGMVGDIPIVRANFGKPQMPAELVDWLAEGNYLIVSRVAAESIRKWMPEMAGQIFVPAIPVRDTEGRVIGAKALSIL